VELMRYTPAVREERVMDFLFSALLCGDTARGTGGSPWGWRQFLGFRRAALAQFGNAGRVRFRGPGEAALHTSGAAELQGEVTTRVAAEGPRRTEGSAPAACSPHIARGEPGLTGGGVRSERAAMARCVADGGGGLRLRLRAEESMRRWRFGKVSMRAQVGAVKDPW